MGKWASTRINRASTASSSAARSRSMFASRPFGHEKPVVERSLFDSRPFSRPDSSSDEKPTQPALPTYSTNFLTMPLHAPDAAAPVQAKLTVGQPDDPYEQEADRMAEQVMSTPEAASQPTVQREAIEIEDVQTKPSLQRSSDGSLQADSDLENQLNSSKGGGSPLPDEVRSQMEPQFGSDFSQVRVHTDNPAVQMNQDLNAEAFTHKQDIYFGSGRYNPGSNAGKQLLAHELTHVVQQTGGVQTKPNQEPTVQRECSACEEEGAVQRKSNEISASSEIGIQRWFGGDDEEKKEPENNSGGGVLDWVKEKASGAVETVTQVGGDTVDWAKEKGSAAVDTVTQTGSDAYDWVKEKGSAAVDTVTQTGSDAYDWVKEKGSAAVDTVTQTGSDAYDWVKEKGDEVADFPGVDDAVMQTLTQLEEMLKEYTPLPEGLQKLYEELTAEKEHLEASTEEISAQSITDNAIQQVSGNKDGGQDFSGWGGSAGDCGLCLGFKEAGNAAHRQVQNQFYAENPSSESEFQIRIDSILKGKIDLVIKDDKLKRIEIGEIKPANDHNAAVGMEQLLGYVDLLKVAFPDYTVAPLKRPIQNQPLPFLTGSTNCPQQQLQVRSSPFGLYFYSCTPTYAELKAKGCKCGDEKRILDPVPVPSRELLAALLALITAITIFGISKNPVAGAAALAAAAVFLRLVRQSSDQIDPTA